MLKIELIGDWVSLDNNYRAVKKALAYRSKEKACIKKR